MPNPRGSTRNLPANYQILNYIRQDASAEYRMRVPVASQSNVGQIAEFLWNPMNGRYRNEFIGALINRIGEVIIRSRRWTDPFKEFKKKDIPYGATVEEIGIGLLYSHTRDYNDTAELLRVHKPYVKSAFHQTVRNETIPLTVDEVELRQAFLEEYGLSNFVAGLMDAQINTDEYNEYLTVLAVLNEHDKAHGFFKVQIPDLEEDDNIERNAKKVLRQLQTLAGKMEFMKSDYLALDCPREIKTHSDRSRMVLFCTPAFLSAENVEALAVLFHMEKGDIPYRIRLVDEFMNPDWQALLMDEDALIMHDQFYRTDTFYNPATASTNYYLHHKQIIGVSPFLNAVVLTTGEGTALPSVTVSAVSPFKLGMIDPDTGEVLEELPQDIAPGSDIQLIGWEKVTMSGTDWNGNPAEYVAINGSNINVTRKRDTSVATNATAGSDAWIDSNGVLHVPYDFMLQLDGSTPPANIELDVCATSAVFGTKDGEPIATPDSIRVRGKVVSSGGTLYSTNELTRAAYARYTQGWVEPEGDAATDTP